MPPLVNPSETLGVLRRHGLRLSKRYGQNFLVDGNVLRNIVNAAEIEPGEPVLEVGPGIGTLTQALLAAGARVTSIEIDPRLREILADTLKDAGPVQIVAADAMRVGPDELPEPPRKLVANLPYNIAAPLIIEYFLRFPMLDRMVVMVQAEIASRLLAQPGNKIYGAITAKLAYLATGRKVCGVARRAFIPPPNVDSVVIRLDRIRDRESGADLSPERTASLFSFIESAFASRRKMIRNSLLQQIEKERAEEFAGRLDRALAASGLTGQERAEQLDLSQLTRLHSELEPWTT